MCGRTKPTGFTYSKLLSASIFGTSLRSLRPRFSLTSKKGATPKSDFQRRRFSPRLGHAEVVPSGGVAHADHLRKERRDLRAQRLRGQRAPELLL